MKPGARNAYGIAERRNEREPPRRRIPLRRREARPEPGRASLPAAIAAFCDRTVADTVTAASLRGGQQRIDVVGSLVESGLDSRLAFERGRQIILQRRVDLWFVRHRWA